MEQISENEFMKQAVAFGHDTDALKQGKEEIRYFTVQHIDDFLPFASSASQEEKAKRKPHFFTSPLQKRQRLPQGVHDRGEGYIFANVELTEDDRRKIQSFFPVPVRTLSITEKIVRKNECWDVTATCEQQAGKIYNLMNIGRLILEEGSRIVVRGNIFTLLCQEMIIRNSNAGVADDYQIGILPVPDAVFSSDIESKKNGIAGTCGCDGIAKCTAATILGPVLCQGVLPGHLDGTDGKNGGDGQDGAPGKNGLMCHIAEITIRHLEGLLTLYVKAGDGHDGKDGGDGGRGGNGGNGTKGIKHLRGILPSGCGGNGGNGGSGGNGGHGGNGGISSNIYIQVPSKAENQVRCISFPSVGGRGGAGGLSGHPGKGGTGGGGDPFVAPGSNGSDGLPGKGEKSGKEGKARDAASVFLNDFFLC